MTAIERFPTLRQSRLATYDRCALQAFFDETYRRGWSGHPQARGQLLHRAIAKALFVMHEQQERTIPTDAMLEILYDVLRQEDVDKECVECASPIVSAALGQVKCEHGHEHPSQFVNIPFSEIKDLRWEAVKFANDCEFDIENIVDIEHRLNAPIRYPAGDGSSVERILTGQLDAMFLQGDSEAVVLDFKSSWAMPGPSDVSFEGYFQQRFYAWLVLSNYPSINTVTLREHYTRYSTYRQASVNRADLGHVESELSGLAQRFDRSFTENLFPPSPGSHCLMCAQPTACPIFPKAREAGAIQSPEMARLYAGQAAAAKSALKQREAAMKAWGSVHGPTVVNSTPGREKVWGYRSQKRVSRPTREQLEQQLYVHGSRVSLDSLYKEQISTRFDMHAPDQVEDEPDDAALMSALEASVQQHAPEAS